MKGLRNMSIFGPHAKPADPATSLFKLVQRNVRSGRRSAENTGLALMLAACALCSGFTLARAQDQDGGQDLAKKLSNPVASLISVPIVGSCDGRIGPVKKGERCSLTVQPVIPFSLNDDWNLISRTIMPLITQRNVAPGTGSQSGLGDTIQSLFFSPKAPTAAGIIWGVGPVLQLPTATDQLLGSGKWAAGPTVVLLKQLSGFTAGILANHLWSFAGSATRRTQNVTFLQPFLSYTTSRATTFSLNTESTYDWSSQRWSVPIHVGVSQLVKVGQQPVSLSATLRYWAVSAPGGPRGFGGKLGLTFLFPT